MESGLNMILPIFYLQSLFYKFTFCLNKIIDIIKKFLINYIFFIQKDKTSKIEISKNVKILNGRIKIGKNSILKIGENTKINANIIIGNNCSLQIGKNCSLLNLNFNITENSTVDFKSNIIIDGIDKIISITSDNGKIAIEEYSRIHSNISVKSGNLKIGRYTGISNNSEIRCEKSIEIGSYCLISYDVCVYDTNTHCTNYMIRRSGIEKGFPNGPDESMKPDSKNIYIGNDVWIGKGSTVLKGSTIGSRCIIGIRSLVSSEIIEDDSIVVSNKSRIIKKDVN
jgi:acetyltransferase-like isoleucine patch superfamily enzyme